MAVNRVWITRGFFKVALMNIRCRGLLPLLGLLFWVAAAPAQVVISEFMADNKTTLADEDGAYSDWIELYNTTATTVNLSGWSLTDDPTHQDRWFFPATNLTTKGFMVIFASGTNHAVPGAPLHTDFGLNKDGEYLALLRPDGSIASQFSPTFPAQYPDISYGMAQNVTTNTLVTSGQFVSVLVPPDGSLGSTWRQTNFNDSSWISGATGVGYETAVPGFAVYNYLASVATCTLPAAQGVISNPSQQLATYAENSSVINYFNTGGAAHYGSDATFPGLTMGVDQNNFVVKPPRRLRSGSGQLDLWRQQRRRIYPHHRRHKHVVSKSARPERYLADL
jgi:hypothetical protein